LRASSRAPPREAVAIAQRLGYPLAMKISLPGLVHKSDEGGVILDIEDEAGVRTAFAKLMRSDAEGVDVQQMLRGGREVVAGFAVDPSYGPLLMFGLGGIYVEVLKDVSFAICPVSDVRAKELVREIRGWPILAGIRGQAAVKESALIDVLLRLSQLALEHPEIAELEINPLLAFPDGVRAVDLRVRVG
jgi:acyl-CoA synthetase (NDP forming)